MADLQIVPQKFPFILYGGYFLPQRSQVLFFQDHLSLLNHIHNFCVHIKSAIKSPLSYHSKIQNENHQRVMYNIR